MWWFSELPWVLIKSMRSQSKLEVAMSDREAFLEGFEILDLSRLELTELPFFLKEMKNLKQLSLEYNELEGEIFFKDFPPSLEVLNLSGNKISAVNFDGCCKESQQNLSYLYVNNNRLTEVPKGLSGLKSLRTLELEANQIKYLDKSLELPESLAVLDLSHNNLTVIDVRPGIFGGNLTLDLSYNHLKECKFLFGKKTPAYTNLEGNFIEDWEFMVKAKGKNARVKV